MRQVQYIYIYIRVRSCVKCESCVFAVDYVSSAKTAILLNSATTFFQLCLGRVMIIFFFLNQHSNLFYSSCLRQKRFCRHLLVIRGASVLFALSHCLTVALSHCRTVALSHCLIVSLSHCLTESDSKKKRDSETASVICDCILLGGVTMHYSIFLKTKKSKWVLQMDSAATLIRRASV